MDAKYLFLFVAAMALGTFLTRVAAFLLPPSITEEKFFKLANRILPPAILTLLIIYSLKDSTYSSTPYGIPEMAALSAVVAVHLWKRNALVSIILGTALFMFLRQFVFPG